MYMHPLKMFGFAFALVAGPPIYPGGGPLSTYSRQELERRLSYCPDWGGIEPDHDSPGGVTSSGSGALGGVVCSTLCGPCVPTSIRSRRKGQLGRR